MNRYTHFTTDDRENARVLQSQGLSIRAIARILRKNPSSVSREFKRNSLANGEYVAHKAQQLYQKRKKHCGAKPKLLDDALRNYVIEKITQEFWTPEEIDGYLKRIKSDFTISFSTIYKSIHKNIIPKKIKKSMRRLWKYKSHKPTEKRGKIPNTVSIHERPVEIELRQELGHWEGDTVLGKRKTGNLGTLVERVSGFLVAFYLPERTSHAFNEATAKSFRSIPTELKKSFTVDNGKEFTHHTELKELTEMDVYFCDPCAPWQRGTNENTNGLLRQFYPKGKSMADLTDEKLQKIVDLINNRPRKRLGWLSPIEFLANTFKKCCT